MCAKSKLSPLFMRQKAPTVGAPDAMSKNNAKPITIKCFANWKIFRVPNIIKAHG